MIDYNDDITISASMDDISRAIFGNAPLSNNKQSLIKEMKDLQTAHENGTITDKQKIRMLHIQSIINKNQNFEIL